MRNVVLYHLQSLDGIAFEDADWFDDGGPEMFANLARVIATQDDILLGRNTYDYWAGYWPGSDVQPFADFVNGTSKHVFTSNPFEPEWANTTVVTTSVEDHVRGLKAGAAATSGSTAASTCRPPCCGPGSSTSSASSWRRRWPARAAGCSTPSARSGASSWSTSSGARRARCSSPTAPEASCPP